MRRPWRAPTDDGFRGRRQFRAPSVCILIGWALCACDGRGRTAPAERALEARRDALRTYLAAMAPDSGEARALVPFDDVLVVVRRPMLETLIAATLPFESVLDRRYHLRVDSAAVTLRTGIALVELDGRAALVDQPSVFADVTLLGALEISTAPDAGGDGAPSLSGRIEIYGLDTRELRVATLTPPAERLLDGIARLRVNELNRVLEDIPIPIRLQERIDLPAVEEDEVTIPAGTLDAIFRLVAVRVMEEGIFVSLGVDRTSDSWPAVPITLMPGVGG